MTSFWSPISINAMSLSISSAEHVNKMPFSGVLARLGEVSDVAHASAGGQHVVLTEAAARAALSSLLGMAVRDDRRRTVGIITAADIVQRELRVEGFLYASDFPDTARFVRAHQKRLGFEFEAAGLSARHEAIGPVTITGCTFTGAAIVDKPQATFLATSIAASVEQRRTLSAAAAYILDRAGIAAPIGFEKLTSHQVEASLFGVDDPVRRISMRRTLEREGLA